MRMLIMVMIYGMIVVVYRWLVVYHYPQCLRKVMLAQFFWKILNGFEWIIFQYINNIFIMTHWNTLKLLMSGQLRCPREAAVWHLVNHFEHQLMGKWEKWDISMGNCFPFISWEILLDFPWILPRTSADTAVVFRYWDSMQISFLGLQHHCKARQSLSLPPPSKELGDLGASVGYFLAFLSISEPFEVFLLAVEYRDGCNHFIPFWLSPWSFQHFTTFTIHNHNRHNHVHNHP